ncbi:MAG: crossover junction endodeoxyribonuclease RuvC [Candidatus Omnitrophica bacterium]|nr:crossover junction endodeoxyribonuclease RuvC [Candidatus Omnitrophota bacterium]
MRVLGIDPGLNITGYGLVEFSEIETPKLIEAGLIRTKPSFTLAQKLFRIHKSIKEIIKEFRPEVLVLEELYSNYDYPRTAILMGHARGVISLAAQESNIQLVGYAPLRIRKALLGRGNVTKEQVARMVQHFLKLPKLPEPNDITDALALALGHMRIEAGSPFRKCTIANKARSKR